MFRKVMFFAVLGLAGQFAFCPHQAQAQYKLYWVRCSESGPTWRPYGLDPASYGVSSGNYQQMVNLANSLSQQEQQAGNTQRYAVGTNNSQPSTAAATFCRNNGGGNGGGGGGGGGGNGGGAAPCVGSVDYPIYGITNAQGQVFNGWVFCCKTTRDNYYWNNAAYFNRRGYNYWASGSVRWDSCSTTVYGCQNNLLIAMPKSQYSSSGWNCGW